MNRELTYGLVACGGKSSRMGRDKAFIEYRGSPQLLVVYRMLENICGKTFASCSAAQQSSIDVSLNILVDDEQYANLGPATALLSAIKKFPGKNFLMVGCDYPLLNENELRNFAQGINDKTFAAAFFNVQAEKYEPLIAYYSAASGKILLTRHADSSISLQHFLQENNAVKYLPTNPHVIKSIDTPEEFLEMTRHLADPSTTKTTTTKFTDNEFFHQDDLLATEEPLEIRMQFMQDGVDVQKTISITMRTPGSDAELAAGFLFTEGIIKNRSQVKMITPSADGDNTLLLIVKNDVRPDVLSIQRNFYATSSCGVCGKASIESLRAISMFHDAENGTAVSKSTIYSLPEKLQQHQVLFASTGGLHASALFTKNGELVHLAEDVGRHNALDKLIGHFFNKDKLPLNRYILFLSGRTSFELVQKAYMAGIKMIVAVGAPSSLAVELADSCGITLIGFLRGNRFNVYTGVGQIE